MKVNLILVDDELASRSNIRLLLAGNPNYELVGDFSDPAQALEWLAENDVQIILSDMNMPKMSGVEFIRMAQSLRPDIQVVAISGYDDFDYLRDCMRIGVQDYLLKHKLSRDVLINVLDGVRRKLPMAEAGESDPAPGKEDIMRELFESAAFDGDRVRKMISQNKIYIDTTSMVVLVLEPDYAGLPMERQSGYAANTGMILSDIANQAVADRYKHMMLVTGGGGVIVLLSFAEVASYQFILSATGSIVSRIRNMARRLLGITLSVGIGPVSHNLEMLREQYRRLLVQMKEKLYLGPDRVYHITDTPTPEPGTYYLSPELAARLAYELDALHTGDLTELLTKLFDDAKAARCSRQSLAALCGKLADIASGAGADLSGKAALERFAFFDQFRESAFSLFLDATQRKKTESDTRYSPQVAQAMAYIAEHYASDISLESCAEFAGVSYTHMSRLFSRETGKRFAEYLSQVRIQKAKALILENRLKMKEIVAQCGFNNYNYFFKVFRELEGVTPNEFFIRSKNL